MNEREFWDRVDALLDERRDPLDDEGVQQYLARSSRATDEYVRLTASLASLPRGRTPRRTRAVAAVAGAMLAVTAAYVLFTARTPPAADPDARRDAPSSSVLDFKITVVRASGPLRRTTTIERDRRTDEQELVVAASESQVTQATLTTVHHRGLTP